MKEDITKIEPSNNVDKTVVRTRQNSIEINATQIKSSANAKLNPHNLPLDDTVMSDVTQLGSSIVEDKTVIAPKAGIAKSVKRRLITAADVEEATRVSLTKKDSQKSSGDLDQGFTIKERFVLVREIGRGGMGVVYLARDLRKEEMHDESPLVALKLLNNGLRDRFEALVALQRETVKSQMLAHPNIVNVHDFDRDGDLVYMSMEYLDGQTLDQLLKSGYFSQLPKNKIITFIEHIARALAYAHKQGFAHADLKPGNVFLTRSGTVKVLDFGIAQAIRSADDHTPVYDAYYQAMALSAVTPNYASPEVLADQPPTPADDMYALGCIFYALLTGEHPFIDGQGNKITALQAQQEGCEVKPIPDIPKRCMSALSRCLNFERNQRFQNAGDFLDAIKPPVRLKRSMGIILATCVVLALISWFLLLKQSNIALTLNDLPDDMSGLVALVNEGDIIFKEGDLEQSHKLYAQAWEGSFDQEQISRKDQLQLKVIIDRRIDAVIRELIARSQQVKYDEYRLYQLQIALEFLLRGELGTMDDAIEKTLAELEAKIISLK